MVYPESSCLMPRYGHSRHHCPQRLQLQTATMADILQTEFYNSNETKTFFLFLENISLQAEKTQNIHMYLYIEQFTMKPLTEGAFHAGVRRHWFRFTARCLSE